MTDCYAMPPNVECEFRDFTILKCAEHACLVEEGHDGAHLNLNGDRWFDGDE